MCVCVCTTIYLLIYVMAILFAFLFLAIMIMLLKTFAYKFLCGHIFPFLLGKYWREEFLDPVVNAYLNWYCFPKYHFMLPVMCEHLGYSSFLQTFGIIILFNFSYSRGVVVD